MLRHLSRAVCLAMVLASVFTVTEAVGGPVTLGYTGTVAYVGGSPFGIVAAVGDPVTGTLTWDTSLAPSWVQTFPTGSIAAYIQPPPSGMTVEIAGVTVTSFGNSSMQVLNNFANVDNFNMSVSASNPMGTTGSLTAYFGDFTMTVFDSHALPTSIDVSDFSVRGSGISEGGGYIYFVYDWVGPLVQTVEIDPRFGNPNDYVSLQSNGHLSVLVLSTDASSPFGAFDATTVDPETVRLGANNAVPESYSIVTADNGLPALRLKFRVPDIGLVCGTQTIELGGSTFDGHPISGSGELTVTGCPY